MENPRLEKQRKLEAMLECGVAMVYLDAQKPGVRLPMHLQAHPYVMLNFSYRFSPPDLNVNPWGVSATLSFEGKPFFVSIPWPAVFAMRSQVTMEFWLFPEDVPEVFFEEAPEPSPGKRANFRLVHSEPSKASANANASAEAKTPAAAEQAKRSEEEKPKGTPTHLKLLR